MASTSARSALPPLPPPPEPRPLKIRLHLPSGHSLSVPVPVPGPSNSTSDLSSLLLTASVALLAAPILQIDSSLNVNPRVLASRSLWLLPDGSPLSSSAWRAYSQAAQSAPSGRALPDLPVFVFPPSSPAPASASASGSSHSFSSRKGSISLSSSTSDSASASATSTPPVYLQNLFSPPPPAAHALLASNHNVNQTRDHSLSPHRLAPHTASPSPTPAAGLPTSPAPAHAHAHVPMAMSATLVDPHAQLVPVDPSLSTHSSMTASSSYSSSNSTFLSSTPQPATVPPMPPPPLATRLPQSLSFSSSSSSSAEHTDSYIDPAVVTRLRVQSRAHAVLAARGADLRTQLDRTDKQGVGQELEWVERVRAWVDEWQAVVDELKAVQIAGRDAVAVMGEVAAKAQVADGEPGKWDVCKIAENLRDCLERMSNYLSQRTALLTSALPTTPSLSPPPLPFPHSALLLLPDSTPVTPDSALAANTAALLQLASSVAHLTHAVPSALRLSSLIARIGEQEAAPIVHVRCKVMMDRHIKWIRRWDRERSEVDRRHEVGEEVARVVREWMRVGGSTEDEDQLEVIDALVALCSEPNSSGANRNDDEEEDVELSPASSRSIRPRSPESPSPGDGFADELLAQVARALDSYLSPHARSLACQLSKPLPSSLTVSSAAAEPVIQPSTAPAPVSTLSPTYSSLALISPTATVASVASTVIGPSTAAPATSVSTVSTAFVNSACVSSSTSASSISTITSPARAAFAASPPSPIPESPAPQLSTSTTGAPDLSHEPQHAAHGRQADQAALMMRVTQLVAAYDALVGDLLAARSCADPAAASVDARDRNPADWNGPPNSAFDPAAAVYFDHVMGTLNSATISENTQEQDTQTESRMTWRELAATFPAPVRPGDAEGSNPVEDVEKVVTQAERRYIERIRKVAAAAHRSGCVVGDVVSKEDGLSSA